MARRARWQRSDHYQREIAVFDAVHAMWLPRLQFLHAGSPVVVDDSRSTGSGEDSVGSLGFGALGYFCLRCPEWALDTPSTPTPSGAEGGSACDACNVTALSLPTAMASARCARWRASASLPSARAVRLRKGTDGWMASLMSRLPLSASEATTAEAETYLSQLSVALEDGKIVGTEAKELARLAGSAGLGAAQVAALNERFLESVHEAALDDHVVTAGELRELRNAAAVLGVPDYFDDLQPTSEASPNGSAASSAAATAATPAELDRDGSKRASRQRRRGHCRQPGHYRTTCPELAGAGFQGMVQDQSGGAPRTASTDEA